MKSLFIFLAGVLLSSVGLADKVECPVEVLVGPGEPHVIGTMVLEIPGPKSDPVVAHIVIDDKSSAACRVFPDQMTECKIESDRSTGAATSLLNGGFLLLADYSGTPGENDFYMRRIHCRKK